MTEHYSDGDPGRGCGMILLLAAVCWVVIGVVLAVIVSVVLR